MKTNSLNKKILCLILVVLQILLFLPITVQAAETSDEKLDFVILLDCTGSMKRSDEYDICNAAAKMFVDLMPSSNARVAVIAFGQRWYSPSDAKSRKMKYSAYQFESSELQQISGTMNSAQREFVTLAKPLSDVNKNTIRDELKTVIEECLVDKKDTHVSVNAGDTLNITYIGGALLAAADVLYQNKSENAAMILISDGRISGFGFDGKERGEIKYSNYDLIETTIGKASSNQWPIYTIELNADGKNNTAQLQTENAHTSMTAAEIMRKISSDTKGSNHEITDIKIDPLVDAFMGVFSKFMETKPEQKQATIKNGVCEFSFNIPEVTSETNVVITGGTIDSISINGKKYASNVSDSSVYFTKNENNGRYSLLKLMSPAKGPLNVKVEGTDGSVIRIQCVNTQDLPIGFSSSVSGRSINRNTSVDFHTYLADAVSGKIVSADDFYKNNAKATISIVNNTTRTEVLSEESMQQSEDGYRYTYHFKNPGDYTVTTSIHSGNFRKGVKSYSYQLNVADYELVAETTVPASGSVLTKESLLAVKAYFTGLNGQAISGENIYQNDETELQVFLDGNQVASVPMTADSNGYYGEYRVEKGGTYSYKVVAKSASLHNTPSSLTAVSGNYSVDDFTFAVTPSITTPQGNRVEFSDGMTVGKNSNIHFQAQLLDNTGAAIARSNLFGSDTAAAVTVINDNGETLHEFHLTANDAKDAFIGDWRIGNSGALTVRVSLNDPNGETKEQAYTLNVTNAVPTVSKEYDGASSITVGTSMTLSINDYFSDNDLDVLVPNIVFNSNSNPESDISWAYDEAAKNVTIQAGNRENECKVVLSVNDNDSTAQIEFPLTVTNTPPAQIREFEIPMLSLYNLLGLLPFFDVQTEYEFNMYDYFSDPDGLPLDYKLFCESEFYSYDEAAGTLHFAPETAGDIKFEITVTDSNGDVLTVKETVPVEHWIIKNIVMLIIAAVILMIIVFLVHKETKIGRVKLGFSVNGAYESIYSYHETRRKKSLLTLCENGAYPRNELPNFELINQIQTLLQEPTAQVIGSLTGNITLTKIKNAAVVEYTHDKDKKVNRNKIVLKKKQGVRLVYNSGNNKLQVTITNDR